MPKIQMRRDTAANWKSVNPILLAGEWALETDTRLMKIGDGSTAYNALPYSTAEDSDEWQKPADWVDIRSGALPNSVYFLVGHAADYATYPTFAVVATVSNSGTYDVFVDGIKQATTASGTETTLNWQTLALESGWDVTYPAALKTHVVRVTPTSDSDTLASIRTDYNVVKGVMWAHFTLNEIGLYRFLSAEGNITTDRAPLFEALTTPTNEIKVTSFTGAFDCIKNIKTLPVFVGKGNSYANRVGTNNTFTRSGIKRVHFKDFFLGDPYGCFRGCTKLESIELENSSLGSDSYIFENCYKLKRLPNPWKIGSLPINAITNAAELEPTVLDLSQNTTYKRLDVRGSSTYPMKGLKGITVSNEAPFNSTTSPQINVAYTGMDRNALVNLFKSMPYNVGYTVVGAPNIVNGIASGFSSSDYLISSQALDVANYANLEFYIRCKTPSEFVNSTWTNYITNGTTVNNAGRTLGVYKGSSYTVFNVFGTDMSTYAVSENTWYRVKLVCTSDTQTATIYNDDGAILVGPVSTTRNINNNKTLMIGGGTAANIGSFGQIDLNETYIKINGIPWFRGTAAMTKTCSIVGCTGTADLTQEDKNIALDKGWELTVA